jgi:hypothetical protein
MVVDISNEVRNAPNLLICQVVVPEVAHNII